MAVSFNNLAYSTSMANSVYNKMRKANREIDRTVGALSSSFRINSASDDAAGLSVSERMRGEMSGLAQAMNNTQDGISMLQTAAGGISDIAQLIQKMRELAVKASTDTLTASDREMIQTEFGEIREEINRITNTTQFNEKKLLNGNAAGLWGSSDLTTYVIFKGSVNGTNESGEKISAEGDYNITLKASAGQAEVQKTAQFHAYHDAEYNSYYAFDGTGIYYDADGNRISTEDAVKNFGFASWIEPLAGIRDGTTYAFDIIDKERGSTLNVNATIFSEDFDTPYGFVEFMNSKGFRGNTTLYGTDYEAYYDRDTKKLGIRSSHDFTINDAAGGYQKLFGSFMGVETYDTLTSSGSSSSPSNVTSSASSIPSVSASPSAAFSTSGTPANVSALPPNVGAQPPYNISSQSTLSIESSDSYTIYGTSSNASYPRTVNVSSNVTADITLSDLTVNGSFNMNIGSGANVTLRLDGTNQLGSTGQGRINLADGASLTIEGSGTLNGLISTRANNTVTINSGTINANSSSSGVAGIRITEDSTLIINGGTVNAKGGKNSAGIGSNGASTNGGSGDSSGTIIINDGTVIVTGGDYAAGIGSGREGMSGGNITINGGYVKSTGGSYGGGIGGGDIYDEGRGKALTASSGTVTINGGTVIATGGNMGAGIGGGRHMNNGTVNINGGDVTASTSLTTSNPGCGAGIGGGSGGSGGNITITGGKVYAECLGPRGAGIGGGSSESSSRATAGTITISGGTVTAKGGTYGSGIGSGFIGMGGTVNITGGNIDATGGQYGSGIGSGGGQEGSRTARGLNISVSGGNITAKGGPNGAGIGGGYLAQGSSISITGGRIDSTGGAGAASIGGGTGGRSGTISIQNGLYFEDNTGDIKTFNADGSDGYIGSGSYVLVGSNVYVDSGYFTAVIPGGDVASGKLKLREIETFYTDDGKFLLDDPQTVTITQGDGKTASFTVYADDTLDGIAGKINDAISSGLGQSKYITDGIDADRFAVYVSDEEAINSTSESVAGTMLIRSAVAGKNGTLRFSGSDEMLKNLGLNTIQKATENEFTAEISRVGTDAPFVSLSGITGGRINMAVSENIDIAFDEMSGVFADWNDNTKNFNLGSHSYSSTVHIKDNSTNLQAGAKENETVNFTISDLSAKALGLDGVALTDRERSAEAITVIDSAIDKVSSENAKVGGMINRLEHTKEAISVMHENTTESESKIRDADMAREYMNFTKLTIMFNARQSVFSQANQMSNNVLTLLR